MKNDLRILFAAIAGLLAAQASVAQFADLVARNGNIWTVDDDNPRATAIAALNGRFVYVGADAGVASLIGPDTEVIDLALTTRFTLLPTLVRIS